MGIGTTVNVRRDIRVRLEAACETTGMSRSGIIVLLLRKVMAEHERRAGDPGSVRYQDRQERHVWRRMSVFVKKCDYDYFLDMRRLFRRSVSLLVAYGVVEYLDVVISELLNDTVSKTTDNYWHQLYSIEKIVLKTRLCWKIYWKLPEKTDPKTPTLRC